MIHIQWDTGYMNIAPDKFFPCSLVTLGKLKRKVINIAHNREEVIGRIGDHLRERERVRERVKESPDDPKLNRLLKEVELWE